MIQSMNQSKIMTGKAGVGFFDKSQTSSPTKYGSPQRRGTDMGSVADTQSVKTGIMSASPMKPFGAFGSGGLTGILSTGKG